MNATETELKAMSGRFTADTEPDAESVQGWTCSLCGLPCAPSQSPYAHNTCSQQCARTAAIVEAISGMMALLGTARRDYPSGYVFKTHHD